jgi:hypothetical protein
MTSQERKTATPEHKNMLTVHGWLRGNVDSFLTLPMVLTLRRCSQELRTVYGPQSRASPLWVRLRPGINALCAAAPSISPECITMLLTLYSSPLAHKYAHAVGEIAHIAGNLALIKWFWYYMLDYGEIDDLSSKTSYFKHVCKFGHAGAVAWMLGVAAQPLTRLEYSLSIATRLRNTKKARLLSMARSGHVEVAECILHSDGYLLKYWETGMELLKTACLYGHLEFAEWIMGHFPLDIDAVRLCHLVVHMCDSEAYMSVRWLIKKFDLDRDHDVAAIANIAILLADGDPTIYRWFCNRFNITADCN